jgi:hypothetical protein
MINNPERYACHNKQLEVLFNYLRELGHTCLLPSEAFNREADKAGWDFGFDATINGRIIDLKTFGLKKGPTSYWWDSQFSKFRGKRPFYKNQLTEYFIHQTGNNPADWPVAIAPRLQKSKFDNGMPWYPTQCVMTMDAFLKQTS